MTKLDLHIRLVEKSDLEQISGIHLAALPDDFASLLGERFLSKTFYPTLLTKSEVALCAVDPLSKRLQGYIFFSTDPSIFRNVLLRNFLYMAYLAVPRIFQSSFWRYLFEVVILLSKSDLRLRGAELLYIAVNGKYRDHGIGGMLVHAGLAELKNQGIVDCWVKTLLSTPGTSQFYRRCGFAHLKVLLGREYLSWSAGNPASKVMKN